MLQKNVLEYLEASAERCPERVAFADEKEQFTFAQLHSCARSLGTALAGLTPRHNAPVCVLVERSAAALAAFMGVLSSGNFYVPIDSQMPLSRMESIFNTLSPAALVYPASLADTAGALTRFCPVLEMREGFGHPADGTVLAARRELVLDIDPAYVIYTSGSTGVPKGVVISHQGIINLTEWYTDTFAITQEEVIGNQAPFYFDSSVKDVYAVLKTGARMEILPSMLFSFPVKLLEYLEEKQVNYIDWVPSALCLVANTGALEKGRLPRLKKIMFCGEAMPTRQFNRWRACYPEALFANIYGPTEATVDCTYYIVDREFADDEPIPIGRACRNTQVLILDGDREAAPGEPGELCIRGRCLSMGYYNNPEKTAEVFVPNPLNPHYPERIYRTGDIVRLNERGEIVFLARKDHQIKHMGYRIELGEIETGLRSIPSIREVACLFDQGRDKILCIYTGEEEGGAVAKQARALLPRYMVPNVYHRLEEMPHNSSGKIHRAQLEKEYVHGAG